MRYLDSGERTRENTLGHWIGTEDPGQVTSFRCQTGYFGTSGLGCFRDILAHLTTNNLLTRFVIGSNERDTLQSDVDSLVDLIQIPRSNAAIAVIAHSGALFHPKVFHLRRTDGSQLAYVGSANLSRRAIDGTNTEAGVLIDTRHGDIDDVPDQLGNSIDAWFDGSRPASRIVSNHADVQSLVNDGILGVSRAPRPLINGGTGSGGTTTPPPTQGPLISTPTIALGSTTTTDQSTSPQPAANNDVYLVAEIGKGDRWKQANFPIEIMRNFFGVEPTHHDEIELSAIDAMGAVDSTLTTPIVAVRSQNYRIELHSVSGFPYPTTGRPIGVFRKTGLLTFRYRVVMPSEPAHAALDGFLSTNYSGPARQLRRVQADPASILAVWPTCPV